METKTDYYRHGDVLLTKVENVKGEKLDHLTLAEGEVTGHSHRITEGNAQLYKYEDETYLRVISNVAKLTHEEHHMEEIPCGCYKVEIQRTYTPEGWKKVQD